MSQGLCPQVLVRVTTPSFHAVLPAWEPTLNSGLEPQLPQSVCSLVLWTSTSLLTG